MPVVTLKNKINKSLEEMDEAHLRSAHMIIKEFASQQNIATLKLVYI